FATHSEIEGEDLMASVTRYALEAICDHPFETPLDIQRETFDDIYRHAQKITQKNDLRKTFALNALVGVDNALWTLYFRENHCKTFDDIIPESCRPGLSFRHDKVAAIPLMAYAIPVPEIVQAVDSGYFFMKIKIGQPGTQEEMLEKDKARLTEVHAAIGNRQTPYTKSGKLPYYFDANGRYEKKETLLKLIDHAQKIGAADQIAIIEEPFDEFAEIDVHDVPVRLAADESAHTVEDAIERIERGYRAMALKPAAKTLSMSMQIAQAAFERNVPCFCADLTVNPILVDWNKNVAARLAPFPDIGIGLLESNGHQNYRNWPTMLSYLPEPDAPWVQPEGGVYHTEESFYRQSGNIFVDPKHYRPE
ncbi:MAG: mandelate racemase/muconate lactonizing enzyme family protein, partial [Planctomycetia bacterium]|nr:mandelate racemase/muconate lactonizing enzyme family protein [Planctomycetia bacterium]